MPRPDQPADRAKGRTAARARRANGIAYVLPVEADPGLDQRHEARRLARLLKALLRRYGFRCTSVIRDPAPAREEAAA